VDGSAAGFNPRWSVGVVVGRDLCAEPRKLGAENGPVCWGDTKGEEREEESDNDFSPWGLVELRIGRCSALIRSSRQESCQAAPAQENEWVYRDLRYVLLRSEEVGIDICYQFPF